MQVQGGNPGVNNHFGPGGSISPVKQKQEGLTPGSQYSIEMPLTNETSLRCQASHNLCVAPAQPKIKLDQTIPVHPVVLFLHRFEKVRCFMLYSHLPLLVRFKRTRVRFPPWSGSFEEV
ncbi:hypothetical protein ATANTOWER_020235 [Ataeniobius toweri]|uniref:Uncharacterized protein n=1 Tax=Ataeniobius toweri TaxID=208326 RepID=A0ABU7CCG1_9TELE|nr:hypothetical protein [Ataeniobius toweri]